MSPTSVVGIDLGTTFSCVAYFRNEKAEVIPDRYGDRLIPSLVFYDPDTGEVSVGKIAYELATTCPSNALRDIKRIIGRKYNDEFLIKYRNSNQAHFSIVQGDNDLAAFQINVKSKLITKTPEEVSSEILKYLKNSASSYLDKNITEAVISIPAYFSNAQRKATKKAAELAGLTVLKLISEPTAGAIHYVKDRNMNSKLLVFDWGGGTLDMSLIRVQDRSLEVKAVYGDTLLGGRDIDEILFQHFYIPVARSPIRFRRRLLQECITLKEHLSMTNKITKIMECVDGDKDLTLSMDRSEFEKLTEPIFQRLMNILEVGLLDAGWDKTDVDDVVLVGGSTRIPKVSQLLKTFFNIGDAKTDLNPDEAVACGASIQAALISKNLEILENYQITEVTPLSLGILRGENLFFKLVEKNSLIPISKSETIPATTLNDQTSVLIEIYEGERKKCSYNNKLGTFVVSGLPKGRAGNVKITINFNLDENGILTVTASSDHSSLKNNSLTITMGEFRLSERRVEMTIDEARKLKHDDDMFEEFECLKGFAVRQCHHILYNCNKISSTIRRKYVENKCTEFLKDLKKCNDIKEIENLFRILLDSVPDCLKES